MIRRRLPAAVVVIGFAAAGTAAAGTVAAVTRPTSVTPSRHAPPRAQTTVSPTTADPGPLKRVVLPDTLAIAAKSVTKAQLDKVAGLHRVRDVITVDAGAVRLRGGLVNVFAVDPSRFRSWTPPGTAKKKALWSALARDKFVVSDEVRHKLGLRTGLRYTVIGKTSATMTMGGSGSLGLPGVDLLVSRSVGRRIGLVRDLAVLINAPGADPEKLGTKVRRALGDGSQVLDLHEKKNRPSAGKSTPSGKAASYLALYKQAAVTCHGLSWTILAAIGQIESDHGRNNGPSSAGALGPMQFMPATWKAYGVDGDHDGEADIMNPYDAVPAAAKYLCANGAGKGGKSLSRAIWHYNHSQRYVDRVLALAKSYTRRYR